MQIDGDLTRANLIFWTGAILGTALLAAFAKWPRQQVLLFLGSIGLFFFTYALVIPVPNLAEGTEGPSDVRNMVANALGCVFCWGGLELAQEADSAR